MTDAERAVIDAARAYVAYYWGDDSPGSVAAAELYRAVRALPRPLSEQLAELRVGAVVEANMCGEHGRLYVLANLPERNACCVERIDASGEPPFVISYRHIARIIFNPEADRG